MSLKNAYLVFVGFVVLATSCTEAEIPATAIETTPKATTTEAEIPATATEATPKATAMTATIVGECLSPEDAAAEIASWRSVVTVEPSEARDMSLAEVLRSDGRFTSFRELAEGTMTGILNGGSYLSWLDIWDWPASRMGDNQEGVTLFVPTDTSVGALDPQLLRALQAGEIDNNTRYKWMGHHYFHWLYPSSEFTAGPQRTWSGSPNAVLELALEPLQLGGCPILQTDLRAANGYIHVLGGVIVPDVVREAVQ
jgi:hypothetical protein